MRANSTFVTGIWLLMSAPILADPAALASPSWVKVSEGDNKAETSFLDTSSVRIGGEIRRYWLRTDFVNGPKGWKQVRALQEDNCETDMTRVVAANFYYNDGSVKSVRNDNADWEYIAPGTVAASQHKAVCTL